MVEEVQEMMNVLSMSVFTNSKNVHPDELDPRVPLMCIQVSAQSSGNVKRFERINIFVYVYVNLFPLMEDNNRI